MRKSNSTIIKSKPRPKSAGLYSSQSNNSKSKSSLHINGNQSARKALKKSNSFGSIIPWKARKRHPRIDDCVRFRYPEWRMTGRSDDVYGMSKLSPGPIYIPKDEFVLPSNPKWSLGQQIEDKEMKKRSPGPIYNPKYHFVKYDAPKFSFIARRPERTFAQTTPAPNQYDPTKSRYYKSNRFYTIKGRISNRNDTLSNTPGPTAYNIDKSIRKKSIPSTKIGKKLPDMTQNYLNSVPGPARYLPKYNHTLYQSSKWTIGKRMKIIDSRDDNPGPGHYGPSVIPPFKKKGKKKN